MSKVPNLISAMFEGVLLVALNPSVVNGFEPPRGLRWGMPYDSCKALLERIDSTILSINYIQKGSKRILDDTTWDVSNVRLTPAEPSLSGLYICAIFGLRLSQMKVSVSYAYFDSMGLVALGYLIDLNAGNLEDQLTTQQVYNDLLRDLSIKYGAPRLADPLDGEVTFAREFVRGVEAQAIWRDTTTMVCLQKSAWSIEYYGGHALLGLLSGAAVGGLVGGKKGAIAGAVAGGAVGAASAGTSIKQLTVLWFGTRSYEDSYRTYVRNQRDF